MVAARAWYNEALELARASGDLSRIANAIYNLGFTYGLTQEDSGRARELSLEAVELYRKLGDERGIARAEWGLATTEFFFRDYPRGIALGTHALEIFRRHGDQFMTGWALYILALCNLTIDRGATRRYLEEALPIFVGSGDKSGYSLIFDGFAVLEWAEGEIPRALRLAGYAAATERSVGTGLADWNREFAGFHPDSLTEEDPANAAFFAEGQGYDLDQATSVASQLLRRMGRCLSGLRTM